MNAPVTPTHRALAFGSVWICPPSANERAWIVTGEGVGGGPMLRSVAQALANFGAKQAHQAWNEGYDFAEERFSEEPWKPGPAAPPDHSANPYPDLEAVT